MLLRPQAAHCRPESLEPVRPCGDVAARRVWAMVLCQPEGQSGRRFPKVSITKECAHPLLRAKLWRGLIFSYSLFFVLFTVNTTERSLTMRATEQLGPLHPEWRRERGVTLSIQHLSWPLARAPAPAASPGPHLSRRSLLALPVRPRAWPGRFWGRWGGLHRSSRCLPGQHPRKGHS